MSKIEKKKWVNETETDIKIEKDKKALIVPYVFEEKNRYVCVFTTTTIKNENTDWDSE